MVNRNLLAAKWTEISDRLSQVKKHRKKTVPELEADRDAAELVAFNLMLAIQACVDVSNHLIADEGWRAPRTTGEAFARLAEHGVITASLAAAFRIAVGFRNDVVRGYAGLDLRLLHGASTRGIDDIDAFARSVTQWANEQPEGQ